MNDLLLLALLLDGPKYGYQLKRQAGWMMGQDALHNNIVYPLLRHFLEEGWVTKKSVPGERGQTRQQYTLTKEGKSYFLGRIEQFDEANAASEGAFSLRIALFEMLPPEARETILKKREAYLERRDRVLAAVKQNMELGKFGGEVVCHIRRQVGMEREWIDHLRRAAKIYPARKNDGKN